MALPSPTKRVKRCVPPPPGIIPKFISGCPNFALSDAILISQLNAASQPPPKQKPLIIAITGLGNSEKESNIRVARITAR